MDVKKEYAVVTGHYEFVIARSLIAIWTVASYFVMYFRKIHERETTVYGRN